MISEHLTTYLWLVVVIRVRVRTKWGSLYRLAALSVLCLAVYKSEAASLRQVRWCLSIVSSLVLLENHRELVCCAWQDHRPYPCTRLRSYFWTWTRSEWEHTMHLQFQCACVTSRRNWRIEQHWFLNPMTLLDFFFHQSLTEVSTSMIFFVSRHHSVNQNTRSNVKHMLIKHFVYASELFTFSDNSLICF